MRKQVAAAARVPSTEPPPAAPTSATIAGQTSWTRALTPGKTWATSLARSRLGLGAIMTKDDIRSAIKRVRDAATDLSDQGDSALAGRYRSFAEEVEADLRSGVLPPPAQPEADKNGQS
jgi:hypothetical protein